MRYSRYTSLAVLLYTATSGLCAASNVLKLTSEDFASAIEKEPLMLVEFFTPWCGNCKDLFPHYEKAATILKEEKGIPLATVNCIDEPDLCQEYGVESYPNLKIFRNGVPNPYNGPFRAEGIVNYMSKQSLPAIVEVTASNHDEVKDSDKIVLIAYVSSTASAPAPQLSAAANKNRDEALAVFAMSTDEEAIKEAGVTPPALVLYRKFDEPRVVFTSDVKSATAEDIFAFVKDHSVPLLGEVTPENFKSYAETGLPLAYVFLDPSDENNQAVLDALRPLVKQYSGKVNFVWIDGVKHTDHAQSLNLFEPHWPSFVIQDIGRQLKYPLSQEVAVTPKSVKKLVDDYLAGKVEPSLKSAPVPTSQNEPVTVVVGKNFDDVVFDDDKDVFIEFYAPWCGHCKRLAPIWDSLAKIYRNVKDQLVIAKMDATENDLPPSVNFGLQGYPTLKFKPAGTRQFVDYSGERDLQSFVDFIKEKSKNPAVKAEDPRGSKKIDVAAEQTPLAVNHEEL